MRVNDLSIIYHFIRMSFYSLDKLFSMNLFFFFLKIDFVVVKEMNGNQVPMITFITTI